MKFRTSLTIAGAAMALALTPTASASAAPSFDPSSPKTANPAQTCAFVEAYVEMLSGAAPEGWSHSGCVRTIAADVPVVSFGDPTQECARAEAAGEISYPYAFYADAPQGMGFPGLIAYDRKQCARALWAFHSLIPYLGPPPSA